MKKIRFERRKRITFPVFLDYQVIVIHTKDKKKTAQRLMDKHKCILEPEDFGAVHFWLGGNTSYLIFSDMIDAGTVAHECWHCVRRFMSEWAGGSLDNELVGYHLGYLVNQVYPFLNGGKI